MSALLFLTGIASSLCGLVCLYLAWKSAPKPVLILIGWVALIGSSILMQIANGDRGVAQGVVIWSLAVSSLLCLPLLLGMRNMHDKAGVKVRTSKISQPAPPIRQALTNIWTFILSGPVSGLIALFLGGALFRLLKPEDGNPATAAVTSIIVTVFLWAILSVLLLIEPRPLRRTLYALVSTLASGALAFM